MYQKTNFLASSSSILLIISLVLASSASFTKAENQRYDDCKPLEAPCGFKIKIKIAYPFWDSRQQQYCGHPSLKLECNKNESLTITIEGQTYNVQSINYEAKTFTLSKPQFLPKGECVESQNQLTNSTLDYTLFDFSSKSQNATMFYDCVSAKLDPDPPYAFTCDVDGYTGSRSTFQNSRGYMAINTTWDQTLHESCGFMIQVPILKSSADALANGAAAIASVLNRGFEVQWVIDECSEDCMGSGGRCGYDQTLDKQICFCKEGGNGRSCGESLSTTQDSLPEVKDTKNTSAETAIALGIGIAVCVILSMSLCFCLYRRHKKKNAAMPFFTHNKSYDAHSSGSSTQFLTGSTYFGVHVFNYRELEEATEFFNPSKELGEGGFGTVYYGKLKDGREVAIKRLYENNNKRAEQFLNEVEILANLRHRNLVNLYGCTSRQSRELLLVYEYVPNGTVADHLHGKQSKVRLLPWSTRLSIATETASALVYLHDSDIIHRDVKTQNILLDTDFTVKVADFGLSRLFPLDVTHVSTAPQGTPGYVDPEYHQCYQLTEKSDVYSFGVLLAELISSLPAVDITRKRTDINLSNLAMNKIQNHALHEFVDSSLGFESDFKVKQEITSVSELCFQCLQCTKEMRPSMNEVLKRLLTIQGVQKSEMDSAEVLDIPADDFLMLKGDYSPSSPLRDDTLADRYKLYASV